MARREEKTNKVGHIENTANFASAFNARNRNFSVRVMAQGYFEDILPDAEGPHRMERGGKIGETMRMMSQDEVFHASGSTSRFPLGFWESTESSSCLQVSAIFWDGADLGDYVDVDEHAADTEYARCHRWK